MLVLLFLFVSPPLLVLRFLLGLLVLNVVGVDVGVIVGTGTGTGTGTGIVADIVVAVHGADVVGVDVDAIVGTGTGTGTGTGIFVDIVGARVGTGVAVETGVVLVIVNFSNFENSSSGNAVVIHRCVNTNFLLSVTVITTVWQGLGIFSVMVFCEIVLFFVFFLFPFCQKFEIILHLCT